MPLKALLVEDEPHSLSRLKHLLKDLPEAEIVGAAENGEDAVRLIDDLAPDVVLLDIQLPGMTGFDVLARTRRRPAVIFITAFDQYAVKAFEENAVDYLLKPTSKDRLRKALAKVARSPQPPDPNLLEDLRRMLTTSRPGRIFSVKHQDEILLIPESDICFFKAEEKYVFLHTADKSFFYEATLKELESTLAPELFIRIHKNAIVAVYKIKKLQKWFLNDYILEMRDAAKTQLRVGRSYLPALKKALKF